MAGSLNKVMLIGNLGADPEVRRFEDGNALARISVATSETYTNKEGHKITNTEWHIVVFRRGLADIVEKYLKKGDKVFVEGRLKTRKWEEAGQPRYTTEVHADNMTMLSPKKDDGNQNVSSQSYSNTSENNPKSDTFANEPNHDTDDDDLPF
ncbi:MAG: single-stranded DNA-binding protein [Cryomorphaceae bacterium]|nr:single-stranded DNA-binding protein [Cryomorphaceae bacterium]